MILFWCFFLLLFISFCVQPPFLRHSRLFCLELKFFFLLPFSGSFALCCNASLCNWRCNYLPELIIIIMIWIKCRFQHFNITFSIFNEWLWIEMKNINRMICNMRYAVHDVRSDMKIHMLSVAHVLRAMQTAIHTTIDADMFFFSFTIETFLFHFVFSFSFSISHSSSFIIHLKLF